MKKTAIICMAALIMTAASCKKEKNESVEVDFRATAESHVGNNKTHLNDRKVIWDENDAIRVFSGSNVVPLGHRLYANKVEGQKAEFVSGGSGAPAGFYQKPYTAFFPYDRVNLQDGYYVLDLPETQTYAASGFAPSANPMAAYENNDDMELHFKNICGVLQLHLSSPSTCLVNRITITSMADEKLWGKGTVTWDANNEPVLNIASGAEYGGNSVKLECNSVNLKDSPCFCFVLPANTLASGFTVRVTDDHGYIWEKKAYANGNNTIHRNRIIQMPPLSVVTLPEGALPGKFSVAAGTQVYFSKGNLQCVRNNATWDLTKCTWQFAEHQYDIVETLDQNVGKDYENQDIVTLFGWGTSGFNGRNPYMTSEIVSDYLDGSNNISATNYDWGVNNAISNGGKAPNKWRTLTEDEWAYLLSREDSYGEGKVCNVPGLIILPDNWTLPSGLSFSPGASAWTNVYNDSQWTLMESAGAVFLPAAGRRGGNCKTIYVVGEYGDYWSSTYHNNGSDDYAYLLRFGSESVKTNEYATPTNGRSVRLVSNN